MRQHGGEAGLFRVRVVVIGVGLMFVAIGWSTMRYPPGYINTPETTGIIFMVGGLAATIRALYKNIGTRFATWLNVGSGTLLVVGCLVRAFDVFLTGGATAVTESLGWINNDSESPRLVSLFISGLLWAFVGSGVWVSWAPLIARMDGRDDWWTK